MTDAGTTTLTMIESYKGNNGGDALNTSAGNALSGLGAPSKLYGSSRRVGGVLLVMMVCAVLVVVVRTASLIPHQV
ncbi:hypothetical protein ABC733_17045 [Mangrovibacter sp. SLW1]